MLIRKRGKSFPAAVAAVYGHHSEIALEGHSSMHAPQLVHFAASMTAMSSQVIAPEGQTSTHAPHATHSDSFTVTIWITSVRRPAKRYKKLCKRR